MLEALGTPVVAGSVQAEPPAHHRSAFRELLSELNPLQYLPVIGTIYRAVTGDQIPETARTVGSLVVSGLMGGPVGVAMSVAALAVERATGLDPEKIGHEVLADLGIGSREPKAVPAAAPVAVAVAETTAPPVAWSAAQLKTYGVVTAADGTLSHGDLHGADALNDMELARLGTNGVAQG